MAGLSQEKDVMSTCFWRRLLPALVLLALIPSVEAWAEATDTSAGAAAISEGNRAFRSGDYRAAISSYLASRRQGGESAVVNFNLGVAYYRVGEYAEAEQWLGRAARDSQYSSRARYNLGLVYWARGDTRSAKSEFKEVEQMASSRELRSLSHRALAELRRGADSPALRRSRSVGIDEGFSVLTSVKLGIDDNIYRSPDAPYVDLAQVGHPVVTPVPVSGTFVETGLTAQNILWGGRHVLLRAAYEFDGHYYTDRQFNVADESSHRLAITARKALGPRLDRTLFMGMYLGHHDEINFDPDSGQARVVASEDISDRFKYWSSVAIADYERPVGPVVVGIRGMTELRDYGKVVSVSEYDNRFFLAGASARIPILRRTQLKIGYDRYLRNYEDRLALDANGALNVTNPTLEYQYDALTLMAQFDLGSAEIEVGYALTNRDDSFAGYNDYQRGAIHLRGSWQPMRRLKLQFAGVSESYDYPNAFAFDTPQGGPKTLDDIEAEISARFSVTRHLQLWAEARYRNVDSSDPRYAYSRVQIPVGLLWAERF
jgi:tetratricopeptide (TPR) repeat protein